MFVTYIVHTQCSHLFKRYRVCPVVVRLISPRVVARQSLQTSAAIMACDLPPQCKRLRLHAFEQGSRTESDNPMTAVKCYYCNTVILPPCLHIIHNLDGHERREEEKTVHKDCLRPYLQNFATAAVKRYSAGFRLYGKIPGRTMDNREYNDIYHKKQRWSELKGRLPCGD